MTTTRRKASKTLTNIMSSVSEEEKRHTREKMLIAVKIADALEVKGLTQRDFAKLMDKSESEISAWLSGNRNFTIETLSDISERLGVRLLPDSDIKSQIINAEDSHIKANKTHNLYHYKLNNKGVTIALKEKWDYCSYPLFEMA